MDGGYRDVIPMPVERIALARGHFFRRPALRQPHSGGAAGGAAGGIECRRENSDLQLVEFAGPAGSDVAARRIGGSHRRRARRLLVKCQPRERGENDENDGHSL